MKKKNQFSAALIAVFSVLIVLYLKWATREKQRKRDELLRPYVTEKEPLGGAAAWEELGDRHPDFKYAI